MSLPIALLALAAASATAQLSTQPAARAHVKQLNATTYVKYTSKLAHVVELNFTLGNTHQPGKRVISESLDRIARAYGTGAVPAFTVKHIASPLDGSERGVVPNFTVEDLLAGQVVVANNVGSFGDPALGSARQTAIQRAIEAEGRGYLGFHGSGDNRDNGWPWYTNVLHPMSYAGHGSRVTAPVYKHIENAAHIILQGVLETRTQPRQVPNELSAAGTELLADNVPTRMMKNEWYRFGRDISRDAAYKDRTTILLKYDARQLGLDVLAEQYRRKGGNMYTYLFQVGKGMTSYIPAGHENDELLDPSTGFDGGAQDYDRYVAQTLFFLAGYATSVCDASCKGLPIVTAQNRLTGLAYTGDPTSAAAPVRPEIHLDPVRPAFSTPHAGPYRAVLTDMAGRVRGERSGRGLAYHAFETRDLEPGLYVLTLEAGSRTLSRRYLLGSGEP